MLLLFAAVLTTAAQEHKNYSQPLTAGDIAISSTRTELVNGYPSVTYTIRVPVTASYFINVFGAFSADTKIFFTRKKNGVVVRNTEFPVAVKDNGWQVLNCALAIGKGILLEAGVQEISFFSTSNAFPLIDMISITQNGNDTRFQNHTTTFLSKLNTLKQEAHAEPLSKADGGVSKVLSNPEGVYEHQVDEPFGYTTYAMYYFLAGTVVTFETKNSTKDPVLHLFASTSPDANSWSDDDGGTGYESLLTVTIPASGYYSLLVRPYYDNQTGTTDLYKDNQVAYSATPVGGRRFENVMPNTGNRNFFTCRLTGSAPDTRIFALTTSAGAVRGYNDDYSPVGGDWSWGRSSRIKKNFTSNTTITFVCAYGTGSTGTCDVYMGNANSNAYTDWAFPNFKADDCIQAAPSSGTYNCISWSGGVTSYWEWPLNIGSNYYVANNPLQSFDNFYKNTPKRYSGAYNYTRTGATADNAMVDLWKIPNGEYTHGSVTKPGNNNPHGYNWESKPGGLERSFHPRNALNGPGYGQVSNYYRHDGTYAPYTFVLVNPGWLRNNMVTDADAVKAGLDVFDEAKLSDAAQLKLNDLSRKTEGGIAFAFEELYQNWKTSWKQFAALSDPAAYTRTDAFEQLYAFCVRNGESVYPQLFRSFTSSHEEVMGCELLWRLTEKKYGRLMNEVKEDNRKQPNDAQGRYIIRSMYGNYVRYIEKILGRLTEAETIPVTGPVTITVSPNPVRNQFAVNFTLTGESNVSVTAVSAQTGRKVVLANNINLATGAHRFVADASRFAGSTGDFISVQVTVNGVTTTAKVMVGQ